MNENKEKGCLMSTIDISEDTLYSKNSGLLNILLKDRTTKRFIVWATHSYELLGKGFRPGDRITPSKVTGNFANLIQPRSEKSKYEQKDRTKIKAEVYTPTWVVEKQNSYVESEISFLSLKDYVELRWLEIACGEAPYMVTRYDTVTGEEIPIAERYGFVDKKLQRISQEVSDECTFYKFVKAAFCASYGYEYQGDSLLLARENLLATFEDYYIDKTGHQPTLEQKKEIATIISYNVFQMNGLKQTSPHSAKQSQSQQLSLFVDDIEVGEIEETKTQIKDWKKKRMIEFECLSSEECEMKFDVVIGNPPYQEELQGTSDKPIYNYFMDESYKISKKSVLITPARFLFKAGKTPKAWNEKMLSNEHFKVMYYVQESSKVFPGTDIKGGVVISYHDNEKTFEAIETYTAFDELNSIYKKVYHRNDFESLSDYVYAPESYKLTKELHDDFPDFEGRLSKGHKFDVTTNIFEKLPEIFTDYKIDSESIQLLGRTNNERVIKFVSQKYIKGPENLNKFKLILPKANGSGVLGETLSTPLVGDPLVGHTQTFISIGCLDTEFEANALFKYIKSKFARTLLGVLKITQDNKKATWKYVPFQDFTANSDIDWTQSVADIDRQLYQKYDLSPEEIAFIETHVREMD